MPCSPRAPNRSRYRRFPITMVIMPVGFSPLLRPKTAQKVAESGVFRPKTGESAAFSTSKRGGGVSPGMLPGRLSRWQSEWQSG